MFGEIVKTTDSLNTNTTYTFTYEHGKLFESASESDVLTGMRQLVGRDMELVSVGRALFSNRYVITFIPKLRAKYTYFVDAFKQAWNEMGYSNATLILAEKGGESSTPGGLVELSRSAGETVAQVAGGLTKPLIPLLLIGLGIVWFVKKKR